MAWREMGDKWVEIDVRKTNIFNDIQAADWIFFFFCQNKKFHFLYFFQWKMFSSCHRKLSCLLNSLFPIIFWWFLWNTVASLLIPLYYYPAHKDVHMYTVSQPRHQEQLWGNVIQCRLSILSEITCKCRDGSMHQGLYCHKCLLILSILN